MDTEDGQVFVKNLAHFVQTHEKALANALQLRRQPAKDSPSDGTSTGSVSPVLSSASLYNGSNKSASAVSTLSTALSLPSLGFASQSIKPSKLALTAHHLFYLLSKFDELGINVGPMNIRLETLQTPSNYMSFLNHTQRPARNSDRDSIHSVSSVRSVVSSMSNLWASIGFGSSNREAREEKARIAFENDLKYLYSAFTKIPSLRLSPDHRLRLIKGFEEFPFDTTVPLFVFKNVSALEIVDDDFRKYYGWERMADQLRSLTLRRANIDDPADVLTNVVLDDIEKRRSRSSKGGASPIITEAAPISPKKLQKRSTSAPDSSDLSSVSPQSTPMERAGSDEMPNGRRSGSPKRGHRRAGSMQAPSRSSNGKVRRSGSMSSHSSGQSLTTFRSGSYSNLLQGQLPSSKWRFLRYFSLAENMLTNIPTGSLDPLTENLHTLDLSSNLFTSIPESLSTLTSLRALNMAHCDVDSLQSLTKYPIPAISTLNLRSNRLKSLVGIERLPSLERLDLRDNQISDPSELARLTGAPDLREIWISGNPFTKTHKNYRITIFNLFRRTPGYTEDILIDNTPPTYSERKQLVDRAAQLPKDPPSNLVEAPVAAPAPPPAVPRNTVRVVPLADEGPSETDGTEKRRSMVSFAPQAEVVTKERRRGPKRRIVELTRSDSPPPSSSRISGESARPSVEVANEPTSLAGPPIDPVNVEAPPAEPVLVFDRPVLPPVDMSSIPLTIPELNVISPQSPPASDLAVAIPNLVVQPASPPNEREVNAIDMVANGSTGDSSEPVKGNGTVAAIANGGPGSMSPPPLPSAPRLLPSQLAAKSSAQKTSPNATNNLLAMYQNALPPNMMQNMQKQTNPTPAQRMVSQQRALQPMPRLDTVNVPPQTYRAVYMTPTTPSQDWTSSSEMYKQKIEALRNEVGHGWLSVLSEERGWDNRQLGSPGGDFSPASTIRPSPTTPRANPHSILSGSRTLG